MNFLTKKNAGGMQAQQSHGLRELSKRAQRYPVTAPVRFRHMGHLGWRSGRTLNLSRTGVLFESEAHVPAGTVVELAISLPARDCASSKTMVATAIIVRHFEAEEAAGRLALAARIVDYSL